MLRDIVLISSVLCFTIAQVVFLPPLQGSSTILGQASIAQAPFPVLPPPGIQPLGAPPPGTFPGPPPAGSLPPPGLSPGLALGLPPTAPGFAQQTLTGPARPALVAVPYALPPGFVCTPVGTCLSNATNGIDIRIVTPNAPQPPVVVPPTGGGGQTNPCPPGQVPCYGQTSQNQCGLRTPAGAVNPNDGIATQGSFPWQAYIVNQSGYTGSGVVLDQLHIATAAHKVAANVQTPGNIRIYLGVYNTQQLPATFYTATIITIHPQFNPTTLFNDIAVVKLSAAITPLPQPNINYACLPALGQSFVGQSCTVSGWGVTSFGVNDAPTPFQKQVTVPIVDINTCLASMSQPTVLGANATTFLDGSGGELCAGGQAMKDSCTQDGGAPLVCQQNGRFFAAGLVIWGKGCGRAGVYAVYVSLAQYLDFITNAIVFF